MLTARVVAGRLLLSLLLQETLHLFAENGALGCPALQELWTELELAESGRSKFSKDDQEGCKMYSLAALQILAAERRNRD